MNAPRGFASHGITKPLRFRREKNKTKHVFHFLSDEKNAKGTVVNAACGVADTVAVVSARCHWNLILRPQWWVPFWTYSSYHPGGFPRISFSYLFMFYVCTWVFYVSWVSHTNMHNVCGIHMYLVSTVVRKRHRTHRTGVTDICEPPYWCWKWNLSPLQEQ